ncbi:uncharacterized protein RNJ42_01748 [Nakaseomyces bracarensis]|uniref:uncharacterized protein n=1 Tax=Nakaseomyces bracarensis TaxID=273131 RepID=UPI003871E618
MYASPVLHSDPRFSPNRKSRLMTQDQTSLRHSIMLGEFILPDRSDDIKEPKTKVTRPEKRSDSIRKRAILQHSQLNNSNTQIDTVKRTSTRSPTKPKPKTKPDPNPKLRSSSSTNNMYSIATGTGAGVGTVTQPPPAMKHLHPNGRPNPVQQYRNYRPEQRHSFYSHSQFNAYQTNSHNNKNGGVVRSHSYNTLRPQHANTVKPAVPMLTPYQLQKQKMRTRFQFDNGEVFIPRREQRLNNQEKPNPYAYVSKTTSTQQNETGTGVTKVVATPTVQKKQAGTNLTKEKEKKKLGSFFKRLFKSKDEVEHVATTYVAPEPAVTVNTAVIEEPKTKSEDDSDVYARLVKQWEKVHYIAPEELQNCSFSGSSSNQSSILTSSLPETSQLTIPSNSDYKRMNLANIVRNGIAVTMSKRIRFSNEVYLTDTWAPEVYERSDEIFLENFIEVESSRPQGNESSANTTTQKPEIKREINEFKRNEMVVHESSRKMTHFYS